MVVAKHLESDDLTNSVGKVLKEPTSKDSRDSITTYECQNPSSLSPELRSSLRRLQSNAFSWFMEDECEVRSFEEIKIQGKGIEVETHDLGGPLAPDLEKLRKKILISPTILRRIANDEEEERR